MDEREEVLREIRKRRRTRILLAAAVLLLLLFLFAASLRIRTVTIEGNEWYTSEELEEMIFPDEWSRNPIVFLLSEKKELPFIEKYTASLTGLDSAEILVYEKEIIGCVARMGSYLYFDSDGYIVESSFAKMDNVPEVTGFSTDYIVLGERLPMEEENVFQEVLNVTQYLQTHSIDWEGEERLLVSLVDTIRLDSGGGVTCVFGEIGVYLGGYEDMEEKLLEMTDILPELAGRKGTLYLDTYDETSENTTYVFK